MSPGEGSGNKWEFDSTDLDHVQAVKDRLAAYSITDPCGTRVILGVLDRHGLFHTPILKRKTTTKTILRWAKKARKALARKINRIRAGLETPATEKEADLAERWDEIGEAVQRIEEEKIRSQAYQTWRGGRVIPVGPRCGGPRPESEVTHALQILDRFLEKYYGRESSRRREECLADVLRAATGVSADLRNAVIDQVHARLQEAKKTPLDDRDYYDALRIESKGNVQRMEEFLRLMAEVNDPTKSEEERSKADAQLGRMFGFKPEEPK